MNISPRTICDLAQQADVAVNDAETALHRAEQRLAKAKELQAVTKALYEAAITEDTIARLARSQTNA
jgi:hypothetical protein